MAHSMCCAGASVCNVFLPSCDPIFGEREGSNVAHSIDVWIACLQLAVHLEDCTR